MKIDTSKLKVSSKALASGFMVFGALMQIDPVKTMVLQVTLPHPRIAWFVATAVSVYAVLHNPQVEEVLGKKQTVTDEEVTLKP